MIDIEMALFAGLVVLMFLLSGLEKVANPGPSAARISKRIGWDGNINMWVAYLAGIWEIGASLLVILHTASAQHQWQEQAVWAARSLVLFTALATLFFYFPASGNKYLPFISNVSTIGGLLLLQRSLQQSH